MWLILFVCLVLLCRSVSFLLVLILVVLFRMFIWFVWCWVWGVLCVVWLIGVVWLWLWVWCFCSVLCWFRLLVCCVFDGGK